VCADTAVLGGKNNILAYNGSYYTKSDGSQGMQFKWVRALNTGDTAAERVWSAFSNAIVWSRGDTPQLTQHKPYRFDRNQVSVDCTTGRITYIIDLSVVHGFLMGITWLLIMPTAAFIARYMKHRLGPWWFHIHRGLVLVGVLTALIAFVIILTYVQANHFNAVHGQVGLVILSLMLIQVVVGFLSDKLFDPNRRRTPLFPDLLHWFLGWSLVALPVANVLLGLSRFDNAPTAIWVVYFVLAFVILFVNFGFVIFYSWHGVTGLFSKERKKQ